MTRTKTFAPFTLRACLMGARMTLPLLPGIMVFATAFGAAAAQKDLDIWQALALSGFVFSGAAQMVALELWQDVWTIPSILALMGITATINARMILMGAAAAPLLANSPPLRGAVNLFLFSDTSFLLGSRYYLEGGRDQGFVLGAGVAMWLSWTGMTGVGFVAGALISQPERFGLDLVMPVFFIAMLVPFWKGAVTAIPWAVAGLVALAAEHLIPGYWFIVIGALAGALTGAFVRVRP